MSMRSFTIMDHEQHQQGLTRLEILKHLESCERVLESEEVDLSEVDVLFDISKWPKTVMNHRPTSETALHIAVRHDLERVVRLLVEWLRGAPGHYYQDYVNKKDCGGATVLHLATSRKQLRTLRLLLAEDSPLRSGSTADVNAQNDGGFTALDILHVLPEGGEMDKEIEKVLRRAGVLRGRQLIKQQFEISNQKIPIQSGKKQYLSLSEKSNLAKILYPAFLFAVLVITRSWVATFSTLLLRTSTVQDISPSHRPFCLESHLFVRSNLAALLSGVVMTLFFTYKFRRRPDMTAS